jgi:hypothetical protein
VEQGRKGVDWRWEVGRGVEAGWRGVRLYPDPGMPLAVDVDELINVE